MKILIVEDDIVSRMVLQELLAPIGACHQAVDGLEAMAAFELALDRKAPYDLICLDIMMPNLDGQETLRRIRALEQARGIGGSDMVKVIMTTALDDPKNIMTALMRGSCDGYLVKPIRRESLLNKLRELGMIEE